VLLLGVSLAACAAVYSGCGGPTDAPFSASPDPSLGADVAVVLVQVADRAELAVVDLARFSVASRVPLRSLSLSIDGDLASRRVVSAQCGGPGTSADRAVGIYDVDRGGLVRYVELEAPNPTSVAVEGGQAFVVHGFEQPQGLVTSLLNVGIRPAPITSYAPSTATRPERVGDRIFLPIGASLVPAEKPVAGPCSELGIPEAGTVSVIATLPVDSSVVLGTDMRSEEIVCVGPRRSAAGTPEWLAFRLDRRSGRVLAEAVIPGVEKGLFDGCVLEGEIALADADGMDLDDAGDRVLMLDASTLELRREIRIDGMPAAVKPWGSSLLVVDGLNGRLLLFGDGESTPGRTLDLGGTPGGTADLVVFGTGENIWR
jgi:hypothetical protein